MGLPSDKQARKDRPIARGLLDYFPDAVAEVAHVSKVGNDQHNPGLPMHWSRGKSADHADCIVRHLIDRGKLDGDGLRHSAKVAWRSLAMLQVELEEAAPPVPPTSNFADPAVDCYRPDLDSIPPQGNGCVKWDAKSLRFVNVDNAGGVDRDPLDVHESTNGDFEYDEARKLAEAPHSPLAPTVGLGEAGNAGTMTTPLYGPARLDFAHLLEAGAPDRVARLIVGGTTYALPYRPEVVRQVVYITGPMRGYESYNFPAFDAARTDFVRAGYDVISPADIDRAGGTTEHDSAEVVAKLTKEFALRDFLALYFISHFEGGAIAMLPGWESSTGAVAEFFVARWLGLAVLDARTKTTLAVDAVDRVSLIRSLVQFLESLAASPARI